MTAERATLALLVGCVVLLAAVAAVRVSSRTGLPSLLLYLALGLGLGEAGLGLRFDDAQLTQALGLSALAIILAEGGFTTHWQDIRPTLRFAAVLSTLGVVVSTAVTAVVAHVGARLDWRTAIMLGAIVSSTDAAAVFSVLRRLPIPRRLSAVLESESGFNDAPTVLIVTLLSSSALERTGPWVIAGVVVYEFVAGAAIGLGVGWVAQWVLARSALPASGLYSLATVGFAMIAYAGASLAHASGFLAVYLAALWLGNVRLPHRGATRGFIEALAWLAQIALFVLLGLLASPSRLPAALLPALAVGAGLLLIARPASIFVSAVPFRVPWRDRWFLSWAGLRGAVPIVLATIPLSAGLPRAQEIFDVVFVLVVVLTLVQGPTLPWVARRLGVVEAGVARDLDVEIAALDTVSAEILQVTVTPDSRLHGVFVADLRLPVGAQLVMVVRADRTLDPQPSTRLVRGDHLLVVAPGSTRLEAERRLQEMSRRGRIYWRDRG